MSDDIRPIGGGEAVAGLDGALRTTLAGGEQVGVRFVQPVSVAANGTNAASAVCLRVGKKTLDAAGLGDERFLQVEAGDGFVVIRKRS